MNRSKKIFGLFTIIFVVFIVYVSYDISRKTTFPGSKSQLKERIKKNYLQSDSLSSDSSKINK
jgi:hypothetical protein